MRLGLSAEAAPGAALDELYAACARRGLAALELPFDAATFVAHAAPADGVAIVGLLATAAADAAVLARAAQDADAPVIVRADDARAAIDVARRVTSSGGSALPLVRGAADVWLDDVLAADVPFAWQVDDACEDAARSAERTLRSGARLDYVRLVGGGPESVMQEGRGVGPLMRVLTLAGYTGPLILTPSSARYRVAWSTWLGRRGGWGCGSAAEKSRTTIPVLKEA